MYMDKLILPKNYSIYIKPSENEISQRKLESYQKLAEIKQWGIKNPTKFMSIFLGVDLLDAQEYVFMNSWTKPFALWLESRAAGKALSLDTRIPTPDGDKTMGQLQIGDYVFDEQGQPVKVESMSPIYYNHKCYEVLFDDGEKIIADAEHNWYVATYGSDFYKVKTTEEMLHDYYRIRNNKPRNDGFKRKETSYEYKYKTSICKELQYPKKDLPIHPYILGLYLGDGACYDGTLTVADSDYEELKYHIENCGYKIYSVRQDRKNKRVNVHMPDDTPLLTQIKKMKLNENKYIPIEYLHGSIEQRYELLRGLMDTDGCADINGRCEFCQGSDNHFDLVDDMSKLLSSLGIKHNVKQGNVSLNGENYVRSRIYFMADKKHSCFKFVRKYNRLRDLIPKKATRKSIVSIKEVDSVPVRCISVSGESHLYLCGNKNTVTHNTTMLALYSMVKGLLFNNYRIYICSGTADQSQETFKKIEDIALKNIESMIGLTDVFKNEVEISQSSSNGFIHNPMGFTYSLYNGSFVKTLNSNIDAKRGKRAESVIFDEGGWLSEEVFNVIGAFTTLNSNFKLGGNVDISALPNEFPHQLLYASSASSVDTAFYNKYKDFSKKMFEGDPRYFVADINCDIVINATYKGKLYPASLLNKETVDTEMRNNPEKALREYYNRFTQDGGIGQIIKRALIVRNSYTRPPVLCNDNNQRKFVLAYDPARNTDNSIIAVAELKYDEDKGYTMDIVNCVSFADLGLRRKTPMMYQDQIREIREMLLNYNGDAFDYDNIEIVLADAGSGGGGNSWVRDSLIEDWTDKTGKKHRGLIDKEYATEYIHRFPNAIDKLKLMEPSKYKSEAYEALIKMVEENRITFTERYDNKGYINILEVDSSLMDRSELSIREKLDKMNLTEEQYEEQLEDELSMIDAAKTTVYKLSPDEEIALTQIDAMKEEIKIIVSV